MKSWAFGPLNAMGELRRMFEQLIDARTKVILEHIELPFGAPASWVMQRPITYVFLL